jgi:penicillin-binding protein-related factor A (putative recombinase)
VAIINRIIAGKKAKSRGANFEMVLHKSALFDKFTVVRIPDGCKRSRGTIYQVQSPFDFIFAKNGQVIFVDAKTTSSKSFSYSQIKIHQLVNLKNLEYKAGNLQSIFAGYVINFAEENKTIFASASLLANTMRKQSLKSTDGILIGDNYQVALNIILKEQPKSPQSPDLQEKNQQQNPTDNLAR